MPGACNPGETGVQGLVEKDANVCIGGGSSHTSDEEY